jgi:hypothetical protein
MGVTFTRTGRFAVENRSFGPILGDAVGAEGDAEGLPPSNIRDVP